LHAIAIHAFNKVILIKNKDTSSFKNFFKTFLSIMFTRRRRLKAVNINPTSADRTRRREAIN
jgi:hypothetical protein